MSRLIFQLAGAIGPGNQPYVSISLEQPPDLNSQDRPFECTATENVFLATTAQVLEGEAIKLAGTRLFAAVTQHPEINQQLQAALLTQAGNRSPVYVEIAAANGAEALPWEALCSPQGEFLGLDDRWALGRMVKAPASEVLFHTLAPPVRIAAVLSCLGVSAVGELDALREAVATADPGQVELLVLASEEQLVADLLGAMSRGEAPGVVACELIPGDLAELAARVSAFGPHVLHFFCHGSLAGQPHLELALKTDWQAPNPGPGLLVEVADFHRFHEKTSDLPWLVVLNCCEGAAPGPMADAQSLALGIAFQGVAPAVVGMREPVVSDVANALTEVLHRKLLAELKARLAAADPNPQPLDWARLVVAARDKLARSHQMLLSQAAASTKEWTLPVVYVRPEEFRLQVMPRMVPSRSEPQLDAWVGGGGAGDGVGGGAGDGVAEGVGPDDGADGVGGREGGTPPVPGGTAYRAARLEIEALQAMLRALPEEQAPELRADAEARIRQLASTMGVELPPDALRGVSG